MNFDKNGALKQTRNKMWIKQCSLESLDITNYERFSLFAKQFSKSGYVACAANFKSCGLIVGCQVPHEAASMLKSFERDDAASVGMCSRKTYRIVAFSSADIDDLFKRLILELIDYRMEFFFISTN